MNRCPFCNHEAADVHAEVAHMEAAHPEIIEKRLMDAGLHREAAMFTLGLIGHDRALLDRVTEALRASCPFPTRPGAETRRGRRFDFEFDYENDDPRVYRVTVELVPQRP